MQIKITQEKEAINYIDNTTKIVQVDTLVALHMHNAFLILSLARPLILLVVRQLNSQRYLILFARPRHLLYLCSFLHHLVLSLSLDKYIITHALLFVNIFSKFSKFFYIFFYLVSFISYLAQPQNNVKFWKIFKVQNIFRKWPAAKLVHYFMAAHFIDITKRKRIVLSLLYILKGVI